MACLASQIRAKDCLTFVVQEKIRGRSSDRRYDFARWQHQFVAVWHDDRHDVAGARDALVDKPSGVSLKDCLDTEWAAICRATVRGK